MLIKLTDIQKHIGAKPLLQGVDLTITAREKIGFIGRNGMGKSTLLKIINGDDSDYTGQFEKKKNGRIVLTQQEHTREIQITPLEYILQDVPNYNQWEKIIQDYEAGNHANMHAYSDVVNHFSDNGYYYIKDLILQSLQDFGIKQEAATHNPLGSFSGGEKRFIELVRVMYSQADLLLVDEPTNHMDYIGKNLFIDWLKSATESVFVVTHDRDVLKHVDKIIEIKELKLFTFNGNFVHYLKQNTTQTTNDVISYQNSLKRLDEAAKKVEWGNRMRAKSKAWKIRYDHWLKDYEKIKSTIVKPSFWIDQESMTDLDERVSTSYDKLKEKNIKINIQQSKERYSELLKIENLSLGYDHPLFSNLNFTIGSEDRVFIKGRNGAGKSTLVRTILALYQHQEPQAKTFEGKIKLGPDLRIGEYQQEIASELLNDTLGEAIKKTYEQNGQAVDDRKVKSTLAQYLFDPILDEKAKLSNLSGGQKARFQIIKMLSNNPNILILDEPTNHLDLPSIEELEAALTTFQGGILFISHDNYFIKNIGGKVVEL